MFSDARPAPGTATSGLTMGVEEEFLLLHPRSGLPAPGATAVLRRAREQAGPAGTGRFQSELFSTQLETATGVCTTLDELEAQLTAARTRAAAAAGAEGLALVASGGPADTAGLPAVSDEERFAAITALYGGAMAEYQMCGCHVHVGVPDRETAVAVVNQLGRWLPTLLALSVNSPFHRGRDSGYGSWRTLEQARFPGSGIPPHFASAAAYDATVDSLQASGVITDPAMSFWHARPSPHLPTVEFRAADSVGTVGEAVLQAALARALVRTALTELAAGREAPPLDGQVAAAAVWTAARDGLTGVGVDPLTHVRMPARRLLRLLLSHVADALEETGDTRTVHGLLGTVARTGTGAERQREWWRRGGPCAVVKHLIRQTDPGGAAGALPAAPPGQPLAAHRRNSA
ncbi:glutamate--cysteine ligase [Streptomyces sp. ACA25]|uniref:carboxylate-amine ligase n=1 Tax=Streptomyces sp. ACA25 TaxID=3022596 RepID=UPI002307C10C|nr:glutamate--cysteine ligase [Streptomyces sp. ACA25]MDB1090067.1 glutamate--cysteine ligase [Streptomyces sp. ACA25]